MREIRRKINNNKFLFLFLSLSPSYFDLPASRPSRYAKSLHFKWLNFHQESEFQDDEWTEPMNKNKFLHCELISQVKWFIWATALATGLSWYRCCRCYVVSCSCWCWCCCGCRCCIDQNERCANVWLNWINSWPSLMAHNLFRDISMAPNNETTSYHSAFAPFRLPFVRWTFCSWQSNKTKSNKQTE